MTAQKKKGLGKGLSALLGDARPALDPLPAAGSGNSGAGAADGAGMVSLPVAFLEANPNQPRQHFAEDALAELAASIRERGLLQPILVRPVGEDRYEIVAGERRWRAAQQAGVHDVPVIIRELDEPTVLQIAIIENIQRADLSPIEEARAYRRLMDDFGHRQEDVAGLVSKSRSHVANLLRLLGLPDTVQTMLADGRISMGHGRALLAAEDSTALARRVVDEGLSVRAVEALASKPKQGPRKTALRSVSGTKDADTKALERDLSAATGTAVTIDHRGDGGTISIRYASLDDLDNLCARLRGGAY